MFWQKLFSPGELVSIGLLIWLLVHTLRRDFIIDKRRDQRETLQQHRKLKKEQYRLGERTVAVVKETLTEIGLADEFVVERRTDIQRDYFFSFHPHDKKTYPFSVGVSICLDRENEDDQVLVFWSGSPLPEHFAADDESLFHTKLREFIKRLEGQMYPV